MIILLSLLASSTIQFCQTLFSRALDYITIIIYNYVCLCVCPGVYFFIGKVKRLLFTIKYITRLLGDPTVYRTTYPYLCVIIGGIHCYGNKRLRRWSVISYSLQTSAGSSPGTDVARAIIYRNKRSMQNNDLRIEKLNTTQYSVCVCIYFYDVSIPFYDVITRYYDVRRYLQKTHTCTWKTAFNLSVSAGFSLFTRVSIVP